MFMVTVAVELAIVYGMKYVCHTHLIDPGDIFICLPGGEPYVDAALAAGASSWLAMDRVELASFGSAVYGHPSADLTVIGITGTNGKTTVAHVLGHCLTALGYRPAVQGTLTQSLTTPESIVTQHAMHTHRAAGGTHFIMEVSSHGIDQHRVAGIQFACKLLTNVTQDHLDYHGDMETYHAIKYGFVSDDRGITPAMYLAEPLPCESPLIGPFNYENMQAVAAILRALSISNDQIATVLPTAQAPPGRLERIDNDHGMDVIVDFAHTPDGLARVLPLLRDRAVEQSGRLWVVFGCGGNRDRGKRPKMGAVAAQYADYIIVTQDNPRHESDSVITADILSGIPDTMTAVTVITDRDQAIRTAIQQAQPSDVVVLAGKGHETTQLIGDEVRPFSDRDVALAALRERQS